MKMKIAFANGLFALGALSAQAADLTIFGFELGKPLPLAECQYKMIGKIKSYNLMPEQTCVEDARKINTYEQPVRRIIFSQKEAPPIVKNWNAIALEENGNLVGVEFFTLGASTQSLVLQTLTQKYGKPSNKSESSVQNGFGASANVVTATWVSESLKVTFEGVTDRFDRGRVLIDLPEATSLRKSWDVQEAAGKRAL